MGKQSKANPYPNGNFALMLDFLEELITVASKEKGLVALREDQNGYQDIIFEQGEVYGLQVPELAVSATIMVECTELVETVNGIALRIKENGSEPTLNSGFGLGHMDTFEVHGADNLKQLQAIALVDHMALRVQYYQSAKNQED